MLFHYLGVKTVVFLKYSMRFLSLYKASGILILLFSLYVEFSSSLALWLFGCLRFLSLCAWFFGCPVSVFIELFISLASESLHDSGRQIRHFSCIGILVFLNMQASNVVLFVDLFLWYVKVYFNEYRNLHLFVHHPAVLLPQ